MAASNIGAACHRVAPLARSLRCLSRLITAGPAGLETEQHQHPVAGGAQTVILAEAGC